MTRLCRIRNAILVVGALITATVCWTPRSVASPTAPKPASASILHPQPIERVLTFPAAWDVGIPPDQQLSSHSLRAREIAPGIAVTDFPIPVNSLGNTFTSGLSPIPEGEFRSNVREMSALIRIAETSPLARALFQSLQDIEPLTSFRWNEAGRFSSVRLLITPPAASRAGWESVGLGPPDVLDADGIVVPQSTSWVSGRFSERGAPILLGPVSGLVHEMIHVIRGIAGARGGSDAMVAECGLVLGHVRVAREWQVLPVEEALTLGAPKEVSAARDQLIEHGRFSVADWPDLTTDPYWMHGVATAELAVLLSPDGATAARQARNASARARLAQLNPSENRINAELRLPLRSNYLGNRLYRRSSTAFRAAMRVGTTAAFRQFVLAHPEESIRGFFVDLREGVRASDLSLADLWNPRLSRRLTDVDIAMRRQFEGVFAHAGTLC